MSKVKEILRLLELGLNQTEIARAAGVARSSVQDYLRRAKAAGVTYREVAELSESEAHQRLGKTKPGRPQSASIEVEFSEVERELSRKGVTLALLWGEYHAKGQCRVSYQTFCRRYIVWRCHRGATLRMAHRPGERLFVDHAGMTMRVRERHTGEIREVPIFVAVLGASYLKYAEATENRSLECWLGSHVRAFDYFGGVPEVVVPDNTKTAVTKACRYDPELNRTYQEFAEHYGVAILPTRAKKPRDKAKAEKGVQDIERWVLAPFRDRVFDSIDELNRAIWERLKALNNRPMRERGISAQELFEQSERAALRPLPAHPYEYATWKTARVGLDYHIQVEKHYYSVPHTLIGKDVQVRLGERMLRVLHDNRVVAQHARSRVPFTYSTLEVHMPPQHIAVSSQTVAGLKAWAREVGPETSLQVETIFGLRRRPEFGLRAVLGIKRLAQKFGAQALESAAQTANTRRLSGFRILAHLLKASDRVETEPIVHANLRGPAYYH